MSAITTRRRFLTGLGGFAALGLGGWAAALRRPSAGSALEGMPAGTSTPGGVTTADLRVTPAPDPTVATTSIPASTTSSLAPVELDVICRSAWGARAPVGDMASHRIERLTLHHTGTLLERNADAPAHARAHQRYHQESGFADLAYHFMVDLEGTVLEGRSLDHPGDTFTSYDPTGHLLVCCEGDYNRQLPTAAQLSSVTRLFAWGAVAFDVDPSTLSGHRDHAATSCPGDNLYSLVSDGSLGSRVRAATRTRIVRIDLCDDEGEAAVRAIESG